MNSKNTLYFVLGAFVVAIIAVVFLSLPDRRTTSERLGDAVETLPQGVDKAADQLGDKTPAEKAGDAIQKEGKKAENAIDKATH